MLFLLGTIDNATLAYSNAADDRFYNNDICFGISQRYPEGCGRGRIGNLYVTLGLHDCTIDTHNGARPIQQQHHQKSCLRLYRTMQQLVSTVTAAQEGVRI